MSFLGRSRCACGSTEAEIYVGEDKVYAVCIHCGAEQVRPRYRRASTRKRKPPVVRKKRKSRKARKDPDKEALSRSTKRASRKIDRRYGRGGKKFGEF